MYNFSALKNRPILSKDDLCIIGNLTDCIFDENLNKTAYFLCIKNGENFLLKLDYILSYDDALVVRNRECVVKVEDVDFTILKTVTNKDAYDDNGHFIGKVTDVLFDSKGKVAKLLVDDLTLKTSDVVGVGDILLVKSNTKKGKKPKKTNLLSLAPEDKPVAILDALSTAHTPTALLDDKTPKSDDNPSPRPLQGVQRQIKTSNKSTDGNAVAIGKSVLQVAEQKEQVPPRIISDYNFLLGRTITENVYTYNGELIAYKDTPVTVSVVDKARINGKLLELTLHSK